MNSAVLFLVLVLASIPVAARFRKDRRLNIIYTWPWKWLVLQITRLAHSANWELFGDFALTLAVGPLLAWRFIEYRKEPVFGFLAYLVVAFLAVPAAGGVGVGFFSILNVLAVTLFGFGGYALLLIAFSAYGILSAYVSGVHPNPGIAPALPGVSIGGFHIPLVEGIVALVIALLFHEGAHGVVALRERIPVRRGGLITIGLLPIGAYVEPDEARFRSAPALARLRVYSAGPAANLVIFLLFAILLVAASPLADVLSSYDCTHSHGVRILSVPESLDVGGKVIESPAHGVLHAGDVILELNGVETNCVTQFLEFFAPLHASESNAIIPVKVLRDGNVLTFSIQLNRGYIGIKGVENNYTSPLPIWYHALAFLLSLLRWIAMLNFMIGLVNLLPLPPLDGGYIYKDALPGRRGQAVYRVLLWTAVAVLIVNALPWFV